PEAPDFELTLEPKPRGTRRDVRRERPWVVCPVLADVPDYTVAIGERCLFHATSLRQNRETGLQFLRQRPRITSRSMQGNGDDPMEDFPLGDGTADTVAHVVCPYCGEANEIGVDP